MGLRRSTSLLTLAALSWVTACAQKEIILPGTRFDVRADMDASIALEGQPAPVDTTGQIENQALPISLPAQQVNADWTHRAGSARHVSPHGALSAAPQRVFSTNIGQGNSRKNRISAAPIVAGGKVFTLDASAGLAATSTGGQALWATDLTPATDKGGEVSGGGLAYGAGKVFAATGFGELIAVDPATGGILWRQRLGSAVTGAPAVDGNMVFIVGRDSSAWGIDTETGRVIWTLQGTSGYAGMLGSSAPAITDSTVLLPTVSGDLMAALKGSGVRVWNTTVAGSRRGRAYAGIPDITGDPVVAGSVTYVGNASGKTYALQTASGEAIWMADEGAMGPVLPVGGSVYLVNDEARLVRLDAETGAVIWSVEMPYFTAKKVKKRDQITAHYGPVLAGGHIVVASGDGVLRMFNPVDGALVATADIPGGASSQPALAGGMLYVVGGDGRLHAFR